MKKKLLSFLIFIFWVSVNCNAQTLRLKINGFKSGDSLTMTQFAGLDSFVVNQKDFKVISYSCMVVPIKGQAMAFTCQGNTMKAGLINSINKLMPGGRVVIEAAAINSKREMKQTSLLILIRR